MHESTGSSVTLAECIVGSWISNARGTHWGPMIFQVDFRANKQLSIMGTTLTPLDEVEYRREGPFHLRGDQLISPAINNGQSVVVRLDNDTLVLILDERFSIKLERVRLARGRSALQKAPHRKSLLHLFGRRFIP